MTKGQVGSDSVRRPCDVSIKPRAIANQRNGHPETTGVPVRSKDHEVF